jgi:hypothetical protein
MHNAASLPGAKLPGAKIDFRAGERSLTVAARIGVRLLTHHMTGTEVKVPNGLNRSPNPAIPAAAALWNRTIPRLPPVTVS